MGTDSVFFVLSKTVGLLAQADTWLVIAVLALAVSAFRAGARRTGWAAVMLSMLLTAVGLVPFGGFLMKSLEHGQAAGAAPEKVDGIIVLGGGEDAAATHIAGRPQLNSASERLTEALWLARRFPEARIVVSGTTPRVTKGDAGIVSGADVMAGFLVRHGVPDGLIIREDRSRNTVENARLSLSKTAPDPRTTWVLVTSAFHMERAQRAFSRAGWSGLTSWPVDFRGATSGQFGRWRLSANLYVLTLATKEYVGRFVYDLRGY